MQAFFTGEIKLTKDNRTTQKEKIIAFVHDKIYQNAMTRKEMAHILQVSSTEIGLFDELINELVAEGRISISKRQRIIPGKSDNTFAGTFMANEAGFGFVDILQFYFTGVTVQ